MYGMFLAFEMLVAFAVDDERLRLDDVEALYGGAEIPAEEWTGGETTSV